LLAALAVCLAPAACSKQPSSGSALCANCNVVVISMDTVRADHLGAYGYDRPTSPNVDKIARRSVVFENAISQSSWTLPAHGSMMSGVYPGRLGVTHYPAKRRLPRGVPMLAEVFRNAGYATGAFTGGGFVSAHFGFGRGFNVYSSNGRRFEHNLGKALPWLKRHRNRPFFLFLHGYNAHRPYYSLAADKAAMGLPEDSQIERRGFCPRGERARPDHLETIIRYYDASIHHGDRQVGRFLDAMRRLRLMRNTVILITSDHGDEFFEHGNCDHVRFLYREVINVPYILYVPEKYDGKEPYGLLVFLHGYTYTLNNGAANVQLLEEGEIDWVGLSSPSIARGFAALLTPAARAQLGQKVRLAAISPVTAEAAADVGLPIAVVADVFTWDGIFEAIESAGGRSQST